MQKVVVIGAGRHAAVTIDILRAQRDVEIIGCLDDSPQPPGDVVGVSVIGDLSAINGLQVRHASLHAIIAIGTNYLREKVCADVEARIPKIHWATAIHPGATICGGTTIGEGSVVAAGSVVGVEATIGRHAIVNTGSTVDHDGDLGDFASTGPGVSTGGNVSIGRRSHIGLGSSVVHGVSVGSDSIIGAHSLLNRDCPDCSVWYGVPARFVRSRLPDEPYL